MSTRPTPLHLAADRRAREAAHVAPPELEVRGTVSKTMGKGGAPSRTAERPPGAGLTRRERRVKAILLKELETLNGTGKSWISYMERQKLFKTLDVDFIDREIAKMERRLRPKLWMGALGLIAAVAFPALYIGPHIGEPMSWSVALNIAIGLGNPALIAFSYATSRKALRRRLWIYQALRELSDAEDEGVQLDESVQLADLLIDRLLDTEAEHAASRTLLHRIRT